MHYEFIEIGTSDFDTEIQRCRSYDRGLSVEPLLVYLNKLPCKQGVHKVLGAVSDQDGWVDCYYIPESEIVKYNFPWWLRGCNSVFKMHPTGEAIVRNAGLDPLDVFKTCTVPMYSVKTLLGMYQVDSLGYLKVDTEGHDCVILNGYMDWVERGGPKANQVVFESNVLTAKESVDALVKRMESAGYYVVHRGEDTVMRSDGH
jgi:hypothetical protein